MAGKGSLGDLLAKAGIAVREPAGDGDAGTEAARAGETPRGPRDAASDARTDLPDLSRAGKLVLRRERKGRGGKTVTVLDGLPATDLPEVARAMKKALGCGATVEEGAVVLLGDLADRARDWLEARGARRVVVGN